MKRTLSVVLAALMVASSCLAITKKHENASKAVFVFVGSSKERQIERMPMCTAFAYKKVDDGYLLLTEGHCIAPEAPADATYSVAEDVDDPVLQPVEVLRHVDDENNDVCELHLKTKKQYAVLEFDDKAPRVDDKIFYAGFPEMAGKVVLLGRVSGVKISGECEICKGRILVQIGGGGGASGSPVISEKTGKVIGILEGRVYENGVVVVPVPMIRSFLAQKATLPREQK